MQRFAARESFEFSNGAIGWRPGGFFDCLGPFAKVQNCPIRGTQLRLTCYAQGYANTYFSVPAATRYRGQRIKGFFVELDDGGIEFVPIMESESILRDLYRRAKQTRKTLQPRIDALGDFFRGYVTCLGFTAQEDNGTGEPLFPCQGEFTDSWDVWKEIEGKISVTNLGRIVGDCERFLRYVFALDRLGDRFAKSRNPDAPEKYRGILDCVNENLERAGIDFTYSRNGHSTGFFCRKEIWGDYCNTLQHVAKKMGPCDLTGRNGRNGLTRVYLQ